MPIAVKIDPRRTGTPAKVIDTRLHGNIREGAVPVVVIENVVSKVCDVEILEAVVIVVSNGDPHSMTDVADSCFFRDVHKLQLSSLAQQVAEQSVAWLPARGRRKLCQARVPRWVEHGALHQINVQIAVVVEVE